VNAIRDALGGLLFILGVKILTPDTLRGVMAKVGVPS